MFISYSSADKDWVWGELLTRLQKAAKKVCIDFRDFRAGATVIGEIERAIKTSRKTLMVMTPNYLTTQWTRFERFSAELAQVAGNLLETQTLAQTSLQFATFDGGECVYRVAYDEVVALQLQLGG